MKLHENFLSAVGYERVLEYWMTCVGFFAVENRIDKTHVEFLSSLDNFPVARMPRLRQKWMRNERMRESLV